MDDKPDPSEKTYRDIGAFMVAFSQVEACLRVALGGALNLTIEQVPVVTVGFDFAHLVRLTQHPYQSKFPDNPEGRQALADLTKECLALNGMRNHVAHGLWIIDGAGARASHVSRQSFKEAVKFAAPEELPALTERAHALLAIFTLLFLVEAGRDLFSRPEFRKAWDDFKKLLGLKGD